MTRIIIVVTLLLFVLNNCSNDQSFYEDDLGLELVPLNGSLEKPSEGILNIIDFGSIYATKSLYYLLLNRSENDAININFTSNHTLIDPANIELIKGDNINNSSDLNGIPIIKFTTIHVIQPYGAGQLQPMELGEVSDIIHLDYDLITEKGDKSHHSDEYSIEGIKYGCIIEMDINGVNLDSIVDHWIYTKDDHTGESLLSFVKGNWDGSDLSSVSLSNTGNSSFLLQIFDYTETGGFDYTDTLLVTIVEPNQEVELKDYNVTHLWGQDRFLGLPLLRISTKNEIISAFGSIILDGVILINGYIDN